MHVSAQKMLSEISGCVKDFTIGKRGHMVPGSCHIVPERCHMIPGSCNMVLGRCHMVLGRCHIVPRRCHIVEGRFILFRQVSFSMLIFVVAYLTTRPSKN